MFSLFLTRPYHIYPEHFEYTARVTWDLLFFKSLMLIAILPLYEEARVGHLKKKKKLHVPKKEEGHTASEQEKR